MRRMESIGLRSHDSVSAAFFCFAFAFRFALEAMMRVYDLACSYIRGILLCEGDILTVFFNDLFI